MSEPLPAGHAQYVLKTYVYGFFLYMYSRGLVLRNCSKEPDSEKSYDFIVFVLISAKILVFL